LSAGEWIIARYARALARPAHPVYHRRAAHRIRFAMHYLHHRPRPTCPIVSSCQTLDQVETPLGRDLDHGGDSSIPLCLLQFLLGERWHFMHRAFAGSSSCSHCMWEACSKLRARINVSQGGWSRSNLPLKASSLFDKFHNNKSPESLMCSCRL
jgi:hypothetical protein